MTTLTIEQRIAEAEKAHSEGRIIQDAWRQDGGSHGRELVCALAAFGSDIHSSADCPADLMPAWLAKLVPRVGDLIAANDVPWFMGKLVVRAKRWQSLDTDAWERVRTGFLIHTIQLAVDEAAKAQSDPKPAYWNQIVDACEQMKRALAGTGDLDEAERAAQAAAEAEIAEAALRAAWTAVWAAAEIATEEAVSRRVAEALFGIIDTELEAA